MAKKIIVTHMDDSTHEINIDLLGPAIGIPIGAPENHPGYLNFMLEVANGYIKDKDTNKPVIIGGAWIKKVEIDLGKNLSYEQEFLNKG